MLQLSSIIPDLLANIWKLLPFRLAMVHQYEQGVYFRGGKAISVCTSENGMYFPYHKDKFPWVSFERSGIFFYWAWIENIVVMTNVLQVVETQIQTFSTKDAVELTASFSVSYEIKNALSYWTSVQEFDISLENFIQGIIGKQFSAKTYQEIHDNIPKL